MFTLDKSEGLVKGVMCLLWIECRFQIREVESMGTSKEREEVWRANDNKASCYELYGGQVYVL